jgi:ribonuclease HII
MAHDATRRQKVATATGALPRPCGPDLRFEQDAWETGRVVVAGVDEVGRGALAGPVVAAAVVLDPARVPEGLDDSKKLTAKRREELSRIVRDTALCFHVARIESEEIDRVNILQATLRAMCVALEALAPCADFVLVDGNVRIPGWPGEQRTVVGGDAASVSIAAASIVAKVERDRIMAEMDLVWPGYDFGANAGYGTSSHRAALERLGPSPVHRHSFRGVAPRDLFSALPAETD